MNAAPQLAAVERGSTAEIISSRNDDLFERSRAHHFAREKREQAGEMFNNARILEHT